MPAFEFNVQSGLHLEMAALAQDRKIFRVVVGAVHIQVMDRQGVAGLRRVLVPAAFALAAGGALCIVSDDRPIFRI